MNFSEFLKDHIVRLDGGMGTLLQAHGLRPDEFPERWNLSHPEVITGIHQAYYDAGSHVVCTNTFGANGLKFQPDELEAIIRAAMENARAARARSKAPQEKFIALDIGPSGRLLRPLGDLDFEDAVSLFAQVVRLGVRYGAELILIETMNDSYETKAALLAAKENSDLPVLVSNAYGGDGKLMTGATPAAIGANCSLGPLQLCGVARELLAAASVPVLFKPNAGLPQAVDGQTVCDITADTFADTIAGLVKEGLRLAGGCCGTTPDYIRALTDRVSGLAPCPVTEKEHTVISSYTHAVSFGREPLLIGERINPTGKKRFKQALLDNDMDYILNEGLRQEEAGVHILDVNVGLPGIDEPKMLENAVCSLQAVTDLPLQIDTADPQAMEAALRRYNGKAMLNSVSGKQESMEAIFPLVQKYGGLVVALTLDENGILPTVEGRVAIAQKILRTAAAYGIKKKDIIFDTLTMAVSAEPAAAAVTLGSLRRIRQELGCHTSLGVSNISFGLPVRDALNSTFFTLAMENGLSAAILNPHSAEMRKAYYSFRALRGLDPSCAGYIAASSGFQTQAASQNAAAAAPASGGPSRRDYPSELQYAIARGLRDQAGQAAQALLATQAPLDIIRCEVIPALDRVGQGFEKKTVYLPQLLMSAEAAKAASEQIKSAMPRTSGTAAGKGPFVIATVHGDIHDIGKNIVRLLLENYGFDVVDLGRDVPPQTVVDTVVRLHAPLAGLSALMTTTVPAMEETLRRLHEQAPWCRVVVGGAVLTESYAGEIGADHYAGDAMETVRYAESIVG